MYKLGPSVSILPLQIEYYAVLMKTERGEEADRLVEEILGIIKRSLRVNVKTCKRLAQRYFDKKKYFKSILFGLLGNHLLPEENNHEKMLSGIGKNMILLNEGIKKARKESYSYRKILRDWVLPRVRFTFERIFDCVGGKSKKALTLMNVACMHSLEIAEGYADDFAAAEATLKLGINKLKTVLKEEAEEVHMLGVLLNNLGANCLIQKRPQEAKKYLVESLEVKHSAKDHSSKEERESDIAFTVRVLNDVEKILKYQS